MKLRSASIVKRSILGVAAGVCAAWAGFGWAAPILNVSLVVREVDVNSIPALNGAGQYDTPAWSTSAPLAPVAGVYTLQPNTDYLIQLFGQMTDPNLITGTTTVANRPLGLGGFTVNLNFSGSGAVTPLEDATNFSGYWLGHNTITTTGVIGTSFFSDSSGTPGGIVSPTQVTQIGFQPNPPSNLNEATASVYARTSYTTGNTANGSAPAPSPIMEGVIHSDGSGTTVLTIQDYSQSLGLGGTSTTAYKDNSANAAGTQPTNAGSTTRAIAGTDPSLVINFNGGQAVTFLVPGGGGNTSIILTSTSTGVALAKAQPLNLMAGATMGTVYFKNTSPTDASTGVSFLPSANVTNITPGGTPTIAANSFVGETFNITGTTGTLAAHNNANTSDTPDATWNITVGQNANAANPTQSAFVPLGQSYAHLSSTFDNPTPASGINVTAARQTTVSVDGTAGGPRNVTTTWRAATAAESSVAGFAGMMSDPLPNAPGNPHFGQNPHLVADVVDLTGTSPDVILVQMTYDPSSIPNEALSAAAKNIFIVANVGTTAAPVWVPTVDLNTPIPQPAAFDGVVNAAFIANLAANPGGHLGEWGVDITTHTAFAVVNHNSEISVVPEPAALGLMGLSALGLVARRRRSTEAKAA